jgi:hypothetical protein
MILLLKRVLDRCSWRLLMQSEIERVDDLPLAEMRLRGWRRAEQLVGPSGLTMGVGRRGDGGVNDLRVGDGKVGLETLGRGRRGRVMIKGGGG